MSKQKTLKEARILYKENQLTFNQVINFVYDLAKRDGFIKGTNYSLKKQLKSFKDTK